MRKQIVGYAKAAVIYPLARLSNMGKPKDPYIQLDMDFLGILGGGHCYIRTSRANSNGLEEAYFLYIARILAVLPENQKSLVLQELEALTSMSAKHDFRSLNDTIFSEVVKELSKDQQEVANGLLPALLPMTIMREIDPTGLPIIASYTFTVGRDFKTHFRMSTGPDIILLPLSISLMYEYVASLMGDNDLKGLNLKINDIIAMIPEAGPGRAWKRAVQNYVLRLSSV